MLPVSQSGYFFIWTNYMHSVCQRIHGQQVPRYNINTCISTCTYIYAYNIVTHKTLMHAPTRCHMTQINAQQLHELSHSMMAYLAPPHCVSRQLNTASSASQDQQSLKTHSHYYMYMYIRRSHQHVLPQCHDVVTIDSTLITHFTLCVLALGQCTCTHVVHHFFHGTICEIHIHVHLLYMFMFTRCI